jgi:hypothetical protein
MKLSTVRLLSNQFIVPTNTSEIYAIFTAKTQGRYVRDKNKLHDYNQLL